MVSSPQPPTSSPAAAAAFPPPQAPAFQKRRRFATLRTVMALVLREMSTRYGRTPGGYAWAIAEPLAAILILSVGFSLIVMAPSLGTSFVLFYASGYMPFGIYNTIANTTQHALGFSFALLKYPAVTWVDAILARFLLNGLTQVVVGIILIGGILNFVDAHTRLDPAPLAGAIALALFLGLGMGTLNCVLAGLYPVWATVWSILNRPLFLASAIVFLYEDMPPMVRDLLWYNPLIHIIGLFRTGIYPTYVASYISLFYVITLAMILLTFGLLLMGRFHRDLLGRR